MQKRENTAQDALHAQALLSDPNSIYELGLKYSTGEGVDIDYVTAHVWFNIAAMRGVAAARDWRAELAREMSAAEVAEAQRRAREWLSRH